MAFTRYFFGDINIEQRSKFRPAFRKILFFDNQRYFFDAKKIKSADD
ncbi:hypothetical protein PLEI_3608 [Photobacterium leiognathi lrivu.4.1]|uniref:Uncharacterized protein n=1 Tax=Photobacterium leiognathi lrivu.4.1 TaxID=1248232 RepID=V5H4H2_PHOLE|nr:hypothetical protein PLEI_3608 [Photobacterium leiognathi lrivu.4.1]